MLDGKHVASTAHRLQAWRGTWAAPLPGQALVVLDQQRRLSTDVLLSEEGPAQERSVIPEVVRTVNAGDLWIAARTVCPRGLLCGMARRGAAFLVRQHGQGKGELRGVPTRQGVIRSGTVDEQALIVRAPESGEPMTVRRMTLTLNDPTRDGDTARHLLSNVPVVAARAGKLAAL